MKRWGWILAAVLVLLGVGFAWFWSLAAVSEEAPLEVSLHVERGPVTVTMPGDTTAREATNGMTLPEGAVVRTGEGGRAIIRFYHQAETRLDTNTEVTITRALAGGGEQNGTTVQLNVQGGRVWSRVLRLFDLDSSFSVQTPSVVATVRGTAFDVRANADGTSDVWVSESAVSVVPTSDMNSPVDLPVDNRFRMATSTPVLTAGESAHYNKEGKTIWRKPIPAEEKASAWFTENRAADEIFQRDEVTRLREELDGRSDTVGRAIEGVTRLSERMHLAVAKGAKEERMAETYIARHIASAVTLAEAGKAGLAAQAFSRIENDLKGRVKGADGEMNRRRLQAALERVAPLIQEAPPGSAGYPFKQRLEDLAVFVAQDDASVLYARLRAADARLDEADRLLSAGTLEEAKTALTAAHDGLGNALRDSTVLLPSLDGARKTALTGKMLALLARTSMEQARLDVLLAPLPITTSTAAVVTSTTPVAPTTPKPTTTSTLPTTESAYAGIGVYAQPNPIDPGMTARLSVIATTVGGGTEDVTSRATFQLVSGAAVLSKGTVVASAPGTVVIEAVFTNQGKKMSSRTSITVNGLSATLQNLTASAAPATIVGGSRATLSATASYTTGFQQQVGDKAVWENLTPTLGTLSGNVFTANVDAAGTAQFDVTYVEGGVTKKASVNVTVTRNAQYPARGI